MTEEERVKLSESQYKKFLLDRFGDFAWRVSRLSEVENPVQWFAEMMSFLSSNLLYGDLTYSGDSVDEFNILLVEERRRQGITKKRSNRLEGMGNEMGEVPE